MQTDALNCGNCAVACPGGQVCAAGVCACVSGTLCGTACVDVTSDPMNCGACGVVCNGLCSGGICTANPGTGGTGAGGTAGTGGGSVSGGTAGTGGDPVVGGTAGTGGGSGSGGTAGTGGGGSACDAVGYINDQGKVCADGNSFGIQGSWYAFADGATSDQSGNPYSEGSYCLAGEALGDGDYGAHWGAGIGLDLNNSTGAESDKSPYDWNGKITGFRIRLEGEAPAGARIHLITNLQADVSPFITATIGESVVYSIAEATVPLDWDVANAGEKVAGSPLYSIQIQTPGAEEAGPINLCITEFEPIYDPNAVVPVDGPYVNSDGFMLVENNGFGIQGPVYAISDGNSSTQSGNSYQNGKYCIAGEFSGAEDDWGAGIAFDLNKAPGGGDRQAFAHGGVVGGFRIALSGHTPGTARIQFIVNEPQDGNQPFLAGLLNTTMVYRIDWAQVPTSWDVADAGMEVGASLYTVQLYLAGDQPGPFEVCVDDFEPLPPDQLDTEPAAAASGYTGPRTVDDAILAQEYETWKKLRYHDCGDGSACVPRDENDCISEGIGYGMLITVANDDQAAFDKLWAYYKKNRNGDGVMTWQTSVCGGGIATGSATDGEIDVAMALIQAGCEWGGTYRSDAQSLLTTIKNTEVADCGGKLVLRAGAGFGGCDRTNPSYFAPAYYKVFASVTGDQSWNTLANDSYALLATVQANKNGLVSDWTNSSGTIPSGTEGEYGPDASRTPWRIATDYAWNNESKAVTFLNGVSTWVEGQGGVQRALEPNSTYRGPFGLSGLPKGGTTAKAYVDAWLTTAVDDTTYFPGTLRPIYLLLAAHKFPKGC